METQGAGGTKNKLTSQEIRQCTAVVIAAGREVDMSRFQGIKVLRVSVNEGIYRAEELVQKAASGMLRYTAAWTCPGRWYASNGRAYGPTAS
ncbi:MAG: PTS fructose transporter subunit IIB [Oscillospiraceae bacterium]